MAFSKKRSDPARQACETRAWPSFLQMRLVRMLMILFACFEKSRIAIKGRSILARARANTNWPRPLEPLAQWLDGLCEMADPDLLWIVFACFFKPLSMRLAVLIWKVDAWACAGLHFG